MLKPIEEYFISPIIERSGYNIVNTTAYALLALLSLYLIYRYFKKIRLKLDNYFFLTLLSFSAFGSTKRVITDLTDKVFISNFINHYYAYNFFNVSPFIYVFVAALFLISLWLEKKLKKKGLALFIGSFLFLSHFAILLLYIKTALFVLPLFVAFLIALLSSGIAKNIKQKLVVFAQALDGFSTYLAIEWLHYKEQHVLAGFIGESFGYFYFFLLKVAIALLFIYLVEKENLGELEKSFLYAIAFVAGFSPGFRDLLRLGVLA